MAHWSPWDPSIGTTLLILSEGGIDIQPIPIAKERHLYTLCERVNIKPVIIHVIRRCITLRRKWTDYVGIFITRPG